MGTDVLYAETTDHELLLQIPSSVEHLRAVRLVAADAAERAGFDCDETDDLRIGVDELCHALMQCTDAPTLVSFVVAPGRVAVRGRAARRGVSRDVYLSPVSDLVVRSVADSFELAGDTSDVRFALDKRVSAAVGASKWRNGAGS